MQEYWYPWTPARYRADTLHLTPLEDGVYRRLIDHYMETKLPLPENEAALSRIVGMPVADFRQVAGTVLAFFKSEKGVLKHKKCDQVLADQHERSERHRSKSAAGGKAKAEKYNNKNVVSATGKPQVMPNPATRQTEQTGKDKLVSKDTIVGAEGVSEEVWKDFITHRKAKKAPVTKTVLDAINREAVKAGMDLQTALETIVNRGWTGFKAEWIKNGNNGIAPRQAISGNGSSSGEQGGNGFGGRKSQTEIAADITQQIIRDRRARWEANGGKNPDQGLLGKPRTTQLAITADIHDVEEIR